MPSSRAKRSALVAIRPVTIETETPRSIAARIAALRPLAEQEVVADQGAVEVERDEPDREAGARVLRSAPRGHGRPRAPRAGPAGGRRDRARRRPSSRAGPPRRPPEPPSPGRRRSRAARHRRRRGRPAAAPRSRRSTSSPSGPPSSASHGSNEAAIGRPAIASLRTYGRFARMTSMRAAVDRAPAAAGRPRRTGSTSATAWPTAFSRARSSASGEASVATSVTSVARSTFRRRSSTASATTIAPPPVPDVDDANRRGIAATAGRGEPGHDRGSAGLDEALGLRARDERPVVDREGKPEELLDAPDVGDGLAARPPRDTSSKRSRPRPRPAAPGGRGGSSARSRSRGRGGPRRRAGQTPSRRRAGARPRSTAAPRPSPRASLRA